MTAPTPTPLPRVVHGDVSQIASRSKLSAGMWLVVIAAGGVDVVTFYQVLALVLDVPEWMVWVSVVGFAAVALTLAHYAGLQARQVTNPRNLTGAFIAGWIFAGTWLMLGVAAFVVRFVVSLPSSAGGSSFVVDGAAQQTLADSADATSQRLSALLFMVLYIATGTVAALHGYFRQEPAVRQYGRAVVRRSGMARRHARSVSELRFAEQTLRSIERTRQRREESWQRTQQQCQAAAHRLKHETRLLLLAPYDHRGPAPGGPSGSGPSGSGPPPDPPFVNGTGSAGKRGLE